jgi:CubicO group peptidase (beta-lactamase class C family)
VRKPRRFATILCAALIVEVVLAALWLRPAPQVEDVIAGFMRQHGIPGAVIAYGKAGSVPVIKSFGNLRADDSMPIASLSKPITAEAIFALVDAGQVALEDRLVDLAPEIKAAADRRYAAITIRDLLQHTAGWDRDRTFDPLNVPDYTDCAPVAVGMMERPLDFAPGERGAYSNLGYCWLGIIIERVSGRPYEAFVQEAVLRPANIDSMSIPTGPTQIFGAAGGWAATAGDVFQFFSRPLRNEVATSLLPVAPHMSSYGLGWIVQPGRHGPVYGHWGSFSAPVGTHGVLAIVAHAPDDLVVVALFNRQPADFRRLYQPLQDDLVEAARRSL